MGLVFRLGLLALLWCFTTVAAAFTPFMVEDIRVEGLQRISVGTVFNYLDIEPDTEVTPAKIEQAVERLYQTGFFYDVAFERDENTLVVVLDERPSIATITLEGNEDIDSNQLLDSLKLIGFREGRSFNRSLLDKVVLELKQQYMTLGKYNSQINPLVERLPRNRVAITLTINEGREASINRLKLLGNNAYDDELLLGLLESGERPLLGFGSNDQYSRQKLAGDLEKIRSYYMDRGYINFAIDSTQVSITPEREDVYITVNLSEGEPYRIKAINIAGDTIVPEAELRPLLQLKAGDLFSRSALSASSRQIAEKLGDNGYAFASVNPVPQLDDEQREVTLTFLVDPGKRVYVRRINLYGHHRTRDEVLRRELRQMEAGWISTARVKRSKTRLDRLGFFDEVSVNTARVPGRQDQADIDIRVMEKDAFGNLSAGVGYSNAQGVLLNASVTQDNFLGSGKSFTVKVDNSQSNTVYSFSTTDPYFTIDGISQTLMLSYRKTDGSESDISDYDLRTWSLGPSYGIPVSEYNTFRTGVTFENTELTPNDYTLEEILAFCDDISSREQCDFKTWRWRNSFAHDTRNRKIFPNGGGLSQISTALALPLNQDTLQFYTVELTQRNYFQVYHEITLVSHGEISYADYYGDRNMLPPFERFHAGGVGTVRGFRNNSLGTEGTFDSQGDSLGGDTRLLTGLELLFPPPFDEQSNSMRLGLFIDGGNVYERSYGIDLEKMRFSTGVSLSWLTPVGPLKFSYGVPLRDKRGDELESFQFSIGIP
ncbi:outer membrane protein assembly factor BamA [Ectothiorhodospiraceae bacterium BW-2]|nr:outer membrane protein assembly factor BamA [Ectothiorhodospiraceae bacterium BW-2]